MDPMLASANECLNNPLTSLKKISQCLSLAKSIALKTTKANPPSKKSKLLNILCSDKNLDSRVLTFSIPKLYTIHIWIRSSQHTLVKINYTAKNISICGVLHLAPSNANTDSIFDECFSLIT
jgi:hypothetical protein